MPHCSTPCFILPLQVLAGLVPLNKYVITKQLTKNPSDYPDAKNQPHVQVALRRRAQGKQNGVMAVSGFGRGDRFAGQAGLGGCARQHAMGCGGVSASLACLTWLLTTCAVSNLAGRDSSLHHCL